MLLRVRCQECAGRVLPGLHRNGKHTPKRVISWPFCTHLLTLARIVNPYAPGQSSAGSSSGRVGALPACTALERGLHGGLP